MTRPRFLTAAVFVLALGLSAAADVVRLRNGNSFRGEIVRQDEKTITLRVPYGTLILDRAAVASVEREDAVKTVAGEADALMQAGRLDAAIEKLDDALRQNPGSGVVIDRLARAHRRKAQGFVAEGRPLEAEKCYRRILELTPGDDEAVEEARKVDEVRRSAPAAEKEATLLATLGREREALEMFDGIETVVPGTIARNAKSVGQAHAEYGRRLLEFMRFDEAKRHYDLALRLDPTLLGARRREFFVSRFSMIMTEMNEKGRTLTPARWETLLAALEALADLDPDCVQRRFAAAVCLHELRRLDEAAREYARIAGEPVDPAAAVERIDALQAVAREKASADPVSLHFADTRFRAVRPGPPQVLESVHFVIHHHNDELAVLVARAAEYYLERNWRVFADRMPEKPWSKKCDIRIYPTREEYLRQSRQPDWSPAFAGTFAVGGQLEKHHIMTYQTADDLLASNLPHEITHILHAAVVDYSASIPSWLREGVAVRQEPWFKRLRMAAAIREAREKGNRMSLEQIVNQKGYPDANGVNLFYSQAYALVEAIQRSGTRDQFARFCRLAQNTPALVAVRQVYGLDSEELIRRWETHEDDLISLLETR